MLRPLPPYIQKLFLDLPMFWPTNELYWERVRTTSRPTFHHNSIMTVLHRHRRRIGPLKPSQAGFSQNLALIWRSLNRLHFLHMSVTSILQFYIILIISRLYASWQRRVWRVSSLSYPLSYGNNHLRGSCVQEIAELAVRNDLCRWAEYLLISHRLHRATPANTSHRRRDITYTEMHLSFKLSLFH